MNARTVKGLCLLLGCMDVAYRVFVRGFVRRQIGLGQRTTEL